MVFPLSSGHGVFLSPSFPGLSPPRLTWHLCSSPFQPQAKGLCRKGAAPLQEMQTNELKNKGFIYLFYFFLSFNRMSWWGYEGDGEPLRPQ